MKKLVSSTIILLSVLQGYAQLPIGVGGLGKKKNDAEIMEKSKAKEPLHYIRSQYSIREKEAYYKLLKSKDVLQDMAADFAEEEKALKSWENAVANDEAKLKDVQTLDPKFKWEKLETDYRAGIEKTKEGMAEARRDFDLRRACYKTFAEPVSRLDYAIELAVKGQYPNLLEVTKKVNRKNLVDSIALAKKEDPQMTRVPQLAAANDVFGKKMDQFMSEELPKRIDADLKTVRSRYDDYYEKEIREQKKTGKKEIFSYQVSAGKLEELLKALELWYPGDPQIKKGYEQMKTTLGEIEADAVTREKAMEEARLKKLESTRMPVATLNDAQILADAKTCIESFHLSKGEQLLKVVIIDDWTNNRHKYTNQVISRTRNVAAAIKEADGRCYIYYMTIHQSKNDNGSFDRANCVGWELDWVSDDNRGQRVKEEIKCEYVK